jgi:sortase A
MNRATTLLCLVLALGGAALLGREGCLQFKGAVASRRVEAALAAHLADGTAHRPWPWADFLPVARLSAPRLGVARPVLEGATGETLSFGLGRVGNVLAGHRDSRGRFLKDLRCGDELVLQEARATVRYRVEALHVLRTDRPDLAPDVAPDDLVLVTCHPFDALLPGPERYVVVCARMKERAGPAGPALHPTDPAGISRACARTRP